MMLFSATIRCSTLLILAVIPYIVSALRIQQRNSTDVMRRDLVTLEGCPEHKEFATPYNEDSSGYLFSGMYVACIDVAVVEALLVVSITGFSLVTYVAKFLTILSCRSL